MIALLLLLFLLLLLLIFFQFNDPFLFSPYPKCVAVRKENV